MSSTAAEPYHLTSIPVTRQSGRIPLAVAPRLRSSSLAIGSLSVHCSFGNNSQSSSYYLAARHRCAARQQPLLTPSPRHTILPIPPIPPPFLPARPVRISLPRPPARQRQPLQVYGSTQSTGS